MDVPGNPAGTRNSPTCGSGSSVLASTLYQRRIGAPVEYIFRPDRRQPSVVRRAVVAGKPPREGEPLLYNNMARVLPFVMAAAKPTVGTYPEWARAGLLMSYSADLLDDFRRAGIYAAKILGGEKPGDLPIEQASKFVLVVNGRTAKQLGISVPPTLLADELIE